jgi:hypothetical protein
MTTTYYTPSGNPTAETRGISAQVRAEFASIAAAFTSVSADIAARGAIAGQTWSGTHTFPATTYGVTAAFGSSGTALATLDFVNAVATNATLPGQAGNADKLVTTNGSVGSFTDKLNVSVLKFVDGTDKTKQVQMDASGLTTGTMRKLVVPDRDVTLGGFSNMVVLTTTQSWVCPAGVSRAEITVIDGGKGGQFSTGGSSTAYNDGSSGGASGISVVPLTPGTTYSATIGAGSAIGGSPSAGGSTSFSGSDITTITTANATLKVPGGKGAPWGGDGGGLGGGTLLAPPGSGGYGCGGTGGNQANSSGATAGGNGVVIIRY